MALPTDAHGTGVPSWGPAYNGVSITKSDATDLTASKIRALWIGGAGDVAVIFFNDISNDGAGTAVTIAGVAAGTLLPFAVKKVMAATTATSIVGLI
jgi:hypothetical protein